MAVEIGLLDLVAIEDGDATDTGTGEILQDGRGEPTCPDDKHVAGGAAVLAGLSHLGQKHLARVTGHWHSLSHWWMRCPGAAFSVMSVTAGNMSAPAANAPAARSTGKPPMAQSRMPPVRWRHCVMRPNP